MLLMQKLQVRLKLLSQVFNLLKVFPKFQKDGSWTTESFFNLGREIMSVTSCDVYPDAIARYNGLVPGENRISDPSSQSENVRYPLLMFFCLGDQVLVLMKESEEVDLKLNAAAKAFGIPGVGVNFASEKIWNEIQRSESQGSESLTLAIRLHDSDGDSFPVDEETYDAIAEAASDMHEIPLMQDDGSWTTGSFFALGEKLNTAANDDVRGKAIAKYNELVPEEDLIVDAMSQDEKVQYPELLYNCLGDEIVRLVKKREPIDSKLGAAVRFFGINVNALEFFAEQVWAEINKQERAVLARREALFPVTSSVALNLSKSGPPALIAFDGTVTVADFDEFMKQLKTATSVDLRETAFEKYNALVPEKHQIVDPATNMQAPVFYPATLYACLQEALEELKVEKGKNLSLDFKAALDFFESYHTGKKEATQEQAMERAKSVPEKSLWELYKEGFEKIEAGMIWRNISELLLSLGKLFGRDGFAQSVLTKYKEASGQEIKGFGAAEQRIVDPRALKSAINAAIHEAACAHPQADRIAGITRRYFVLEHWDEAVRSSYAAKEREEGEAFGSNHCADDMSVLSGILEQLAQERAAAVNAAAGAGESY